MADLSLKNPNDSITLEDYETSIRKFEDVAPRRSRSDSDIRCFGLCSPEFEPFITLICDNTQWSSTEYCEDCGNKAKYFIHINKHRDKGGTIVEFKAGNYCLSCIAYIYNKATHCVTRVNSLGRIKEALTPPLSRRLKIKKWINKHLPF